MSLTPNIACRQSNRERIAASVLVAISISVITFLSVARGTFFDDEIFSIEHTSVARSYADMIVFFSRHDLHPAGSYVVLRAMFELFGSWYSVKDAIGALNGVASGICIWQAYPKLGAATRRLFATTIATSGSVVLVGDSLRWYALFDPIFAVTLIYVIFSDHRPYRKIALCGVSCLVLFYLSYNAFIAIAVLGATLSYRHRGDLARSDVRPTAVIGTVFIFACIPQLFCFLVFHVPNAAPLIGVPRPALSFLKALTTLAVGRAVFPLHCTAIIFVLALAGTGIIYAFSGKEDPLQVILIVALSVGLVLLGVTGLGDLDRTTAMFLYPFGLLLVADIIGGLPRSTRQVPMLAVVLFQLVGTWNVIWHMNTSYIYFNTDYTTALNFILERQSTCSGKLIVFDHDPVMTYLLEEKKVAVSSPFSRQAISTDARAGDCVVQIKSDAGAFSGDELSTINDRAAFKELRFVGSRQIAEGPHAHSLDIMVFSATNNWHGPELLKVVPGYAIE